MRWSNARLAVVVVSMSVGAWSSSALVVLLAIIARPQAKPNPHPSSAGVPVRCFQIDSTINDLLVKGVNVMSPSTKTDREQKQRHWDAVQSKVVPDWAHTLYTRKQAATEAAARNARGFMPQPMPPLEEVATHVP